MAFSLFENGKVSDKLNKFVVNDFHKIICDYGSPRFANVKNILNIDIPFDKKAEGVMAFGKLHDDNWPKTFDIFISCTNEDPIKDVVVSLLMSGAIVGLTPELKARCYAEECQLWNPIEIVEASSFHSVRYVDIQLLTKPFGFDDTLPNFEKKISQLSTSLLPNDSKLCAIIASSLKNHQELIRTLKIYRSVPCDEEKYNIIWDSACANTLQSLDKSLHDFSIYDAKIGKKIVIQELNKIDSSARHLNNLPKRKNGKIFIVCFLLIFRFRFKK